MKYRTKLFVLVVALVVVTNGLLAFASHRQCDILLHDEVHRKLRSIAATAAVLLEPDLVAKVRARSDESRPEYGLLRAQLQKIRNANRRKDAWVERIFTLVPAPENNSVVEYGVDSEEQFELVHHAGDIYMRNGAPVSIGIEGIDQLADRLENFQAGYNAAFAPIRDRSGKLIADLGIAGVPAPFSTLHQVGPQILFSFGLTVALALVVAMALSWQVTQPLYHLRRAIESIGKDDLNATVRPGMTGEFAELGASIDAMAAGLRERDTIKRAFSGYLSRQMLDIVLANGQTATLKGERRRVTVLFADIRGFTAISEGMRPEEVVEVLSEIFDRMVDVVLRNHGTIDKFLGDGMMVIFGAPLDHTYQEEHAITAALEMQRELQVLADKRTAEGKRPVRMGIGINSGTAVVGNIGSKERMEYTAIGDAVNLAARLESATRDLGVEIIVSEQTYDAVRPLFKWKPTGEFLVKGRSEPVRAYCVEGFSDSAKGSLPSS